MRDVADAAPPAVADLEHLAHHRLRVRVAGVRHRARIRVLDLGLPGLELLRAGVDPLEDVDRLEAGDHDRHVVAARDRLVLGGPHDRADVPGGEEAVDATIVVGEDRLDGRRDEHVRDQQREVPHALAPGLVDRERVTGRGGLEADGEEHDLAIGQAPRERERVQRRVDDAHVAALGLRGAQVDRPAGDAQHVAVAAQHDVGSARERDGVIEDLGGRDAHRAPRAVQERDQGRQQLLEPEARDRVRLPAAHLHDAPRSRGDPGDRRRQRARALRVSVLVDVLHGSLASSSLASGSSFARCSSISRAWTSPTVAIAKPACTST